MGKQGLKLNTMIGQCLETGLPATTLEGGWRGVRFVCRHTGHRDASIAAGRDILRQRPLTGNRQAQQQPTQRQDGHPQAKAGFVSQTAKQAVHGKSDGDIDPESNTWASICPREALSNDT